MKSILLQLKASHESTLMRAAEISSMISGLTLGPNATQCFYGDTEKKDMEKDELKSQKPRKIIKKIAIELPRSSKSMDLNDVKNFQQQMLQNSVKKRIDLDVQKKMAEKHLRDVRKYQEIRAVADEAIAKAERDYALKMQEFERQVEQEMEKENQLERSYQEQRMELAANTRKLQEEKERIMLIKKWDDTFTRQATVLARMLNAGSSEIESLESYKKELKDLQNLKDANRGSLDEIKNACIRLDATSQRYHKELKDFVARKEAEQKEKAAAAERKQHEEAARQQQEEAAKKQLEVHPIQIATVPPQAHSQLGQTPVFNDAAQRKTSQLFSEYNQLLAQKIQMTRRLNETPELQQIRFALKFAINNPVNLLNEKQNETLVDVYQKLFSLLSGQRVTTPKGSVSISDHMEALDWCKLKTAEKLIVRFIIENI
jgi:hypothetical protein